MKLSILPLLLLVTLTLRAEPPGIAQSSELLTIPAGDKFLRWHGHAGRSYFLQVSDPTDHLRKWTWAPVIENGNDEEISYEVDGTTDKGFFRLKYTNQLPGPGETLETADFDGDSISNIDEISPPPQFLANGATDPLANDTDRDGMKDGFERENGYDPNNGDENNNGIPDGEDDSDGDGSSNAAEAGSGSNPNDSTNKPGDASWHTVTGDNPQGEPKKATKTFTIKKGESRLVVVGVTSQEYPEYTGESSEWDDTLEWKITPSSGASINGSVNVNDLHEEWEIDEALGVTLNGFGPSPPVHIEQVKMIQAPFDADLTVKIELTATNVSDSILPSTVIVGLMPVEIGLQAIAGLDNVDDHLDPWTKATNGKRIFPDFKDPTATELRAKIEVVVKTSPALAGKTVFVKAFDVDDSTSEAFDHEENGPAPVIDTNGKAGSDNLPDLWNTPQNGQFWTGSAWGGQTAQGVVDANGETKFHFRVGMQPGNNYRIVASVDDESMYSGVQTTDPAATRYLGAEAAQTGNALSSPLLTVWRKLWVENDSMEAIPTYSDGNKKNDLSSNLTNPTIINVTRDSEANTTYFRIPAISDENSFRNLENGRIVIQGVSYPVTGTSIEWPGGTEFVFIVKVSGDHSSIPIGSGFRLYDDDDFGLNADPLPRNDLADNFMKSLFVTAFIDVVDTGSFNLRKTIPFHVNEGLIINTAVNTATDLTEKEALWLCQLTAGYQFGYGENGDPNDGDNLFGGTLIYGNYDHSVVFVEDCREQFDDSFRLDIGSQNPEVDFEKTRNKLKSYITATAAHEIGHQPGNLSGDEEHAEKGLMRNGGVARSYPEQEKFYPKSIERFRKAHNWSKK